MSASTSTSSSGGAKVSLFAAKSGFVIPKNKLSGSLVPVFKGSKKAAGGSDGQSTTTTDHVQRKTKWGPDLTQDASVRRGRALAYQTRVDQITQQLQLGTLLPEENQDSQVADQNSKSSDPQIDTKKIELLELEKRESIGEILKLNPSYKPPPDYKPLLKDASVPIPVKEYPGYNFVGSIFGPGNETQKRLEKETGARIQVFGTNTGTGEKVEILSDEKETHVAYEALSIHVSGDTFEKVDAAVALIDLLLSSVSGNLSAGDNANILSQSHQTSFPVPSVVSQGVVQPVAGPTQTPQQDQFQYQSPWFPAATPRAPVSLASGLISHQPSSAPPNTPVHVHSSPLKSALFGPPAVLASGFNPNLQYPSLAPTRPQMTVQGFLNPYSPANFSLPSPQPSSVQASVSTSLTSPGSQIGPSPIFRPSLPQSISSVQPGPQSERLVVPTGSSSAWSGGPSVPAPIGPGGMGQMTHLTVPPLGSQTLASRSGFLSSAPLSNVSATIVVSAITFPSGPSPQLSGVPMNRPNASPNFASVLPPQVGPSSTPPIQASALPAPLPNPSINPVQGSTPVSSPMAPTLQRGMQPGIIGSFSGPTIRSTMVAPKPQYSGTGDFTFRPSHLQNPASQTFPRSLNQPVTQSAPLPRPVMQSPVPQAPSFRLPVSNSIPQPGLPAFPRPQVGNQMGQAHAHMSAAFSNASPISPPVLQMGPRNFSGTPHQPNLAGHLPPRAGSTLPFLPNHPAPMAPRGQFVALNQPLNKNPSLAPGRPVPNQGGQQVYDPFSPTSVSVVSQQLGGNLGKGRKQENDPEYEDLMASVGVK